MKTHIKDGTGNMDGALEQWIVKNFGQRLRQWTESQAGGPEQVILNK